MQQKADDSESVVASRIAVADRASVDFSDLRIFSCARSVAKLRREKLKSVVKLLSTSIRAMESLKGK